MPALDITEELRSLSQTERANYRYRLKQNGYAIQKLKFQRGNRTRQHIPIFDTSGPVQEVAYKDMDELAIYVAQQLLKRDGLSKATVTAKLRDMLPQECFEKIYAAFGLPKRSKVVEREKKYYLDLPRNLIRAKYYRALRNTCKETKKLTEWEIDDTILDLIHIFENKNYIYPEMVTESGVG